MWEEGFSILPHPGIKEGVRARMTDFLEEHSPRLLPPAGRPTGRRECRRSWPRAVCG